MYNYIWKNTITQTVKHFMKVDQELCTYALLSLHRDAPVQCLHYCS